MILHETALLILAVITCAVIALVPVGARWIRVCLIIVLLNIITRRIDALTMYFFGFDIVSEDFSYLMLYSVLATVIALFAMAWRRRKELSQVEAMHQARLERNAQLLRAHEETMSNLVGWHDDTAITQNTEALNNQILQALK